jgi:hypothetical protein
MECNAISRIVRTEKYKCYKNKRDLAIFSQARIKQNIIDGKNGVHHIYRF